MLPSSIAMLYYMLDGQLFLLTQSLAYLIENTLGNHESHARYIAASVFPVTTPPLLLCVQSGSEILA
jgi:hypothetical protein